MTFKSALNVAFIALIATTSSLAMAAPSEAKDGSIRKDFAKSIDENAVHGSDAVETAKVEIEYFFHSDEIF